MVTETDKGKATCIIEIQKVNKMVEEEISKERRYAEFVKNYSVTPFPRPVSKNTQKSFKGLSFN